MFLWTEGYKWLWTYRFQIGDASDTIQPLERQFSNEPGPVEARSSLQISVVVRSCLKRPASLQSWSPWRMVIGLVGLGWVKGWRLGWRWHFDPAPQCFIEVRSEFQSKFDWSKRMCVTAWSNFKFFHFAWKHRKDKETAPNDLTLSEQQIQQAFKRWSGGKDQPLGMSHLLSHIVWMYWDTPFCKKIPDFFNDPRR